MQHAKVTCLKCGYSWTKNCTFGFKAEKDFYKNYKPECPKCEGREWNINEIIEVRPPLNENERDLFLLIPKVNKNEE